MLNYPIIVKNSVVPKIMSVFISVYAISLFPFVFIRDEGNENTITHEYIHFKQQRELLVFLFYVLYIWDFFLGLVKYKSINLAYTRIRFEQEAYEHDHNVAYVLNRKKFSWRNYRV